MNFQNLYQNGLRFLFAAYFALFVAQCRTPQPYSVTNPQKTAFGTEAMVVTAHPAATAVGLEVLRKGGNAVDAAIAVQLALAVVYPRAGNLGGGGFMVYRGADGEVSTLDFREKAPEAAFRDMYLKPDSARTPDLDKSQRGHLSAGVPGTVAGLFASFEKYSALRDFRPLIDPAIELAERGFRLTKPEADRLNDSLRKVDFRRCNTEPPVFLSDNTWQVGDLLVQKDLASTLREIRKNGRDGFYKGKVADLIVAEMQRGRGIITHRDLEQYQATWREPLIGTYKNNYQIISMPPPSSGGLILLQTLNMIEKAPLGRMGFHSTDAVHIVAEAERRSYADRAEHMGDPDFWPVPVAQLLDDKYLEGRMSDFNPNAATKSSSIKAGKLNYQESEETTHFCIVDKWGNAVSVTTTLNDNYGSHTVVPGAGFLLNDEMDDFSIKPGAPNMYGAVGGEANAIASGKRMLSSMTPTIILKDGKLFMVVGTPGGTTIPTSVIQTFLNVESFGMTATQAVASKRFHHQHLPDAISMEKGCLPDSTVQQLQARGHEIRFRPVIGLVECILIQDGRMEGAADPRSDDSAAGY